MKTTRDNITLLTVKEVAEMTRLAIPTVYKLAKERKLPHIRIGDRVLVKESDLEAFLAKSAVEAEGAQE